VMERYTERERALERAVGVELAALAQAAGEVRSRDARIAVGTRRPPPCHPLKRPRVYYANASECGHA
jgi:hypothetical protein